jgi:hypothetical protein
MVDRGTRARQRGRASAAIAACFSLVLAACSCGEGTASPPAAPPSTIADATPPAGISIERATASIAPSGAARRHPITIVRFDLSRFEPVLFTARDDGGARTLDRWVREEHLAAAINAAMYEPDGRPSGLCVHAGTEESPDDARFGGFYALGPVDAASPPIALMGRDCPGFDLATLRTQWSTLVATYRLLDCDGHPIAWVDPDRYSAAAIGLDREGRLVLVHSRTPYRMSELAQMLGAPSFGLSQLFFVEGGPEATLVVDAGDLHVREVGLPRDLPEGIEPDRDHLYELPNVLGLRPR